MAEDFVSKYTKTNFATRVLIDGFYNDIGSIVRPLKPASVLEVGCGGGYSTARLRQFLPNCSIQAIEKEEKLVELARQLNPGISISSGDVYKLPFADNSFDTVFLLEVLEHLENPQAAIKEVLRVTKKFLVTSVPREPLWCILNFVRGKYWGTWGNTPGHIQNWSSGQFVKLLQPFGKVHQVKKPVPWTIALLEKKNHS